MNNLKMKLEKQFLLEEYQKEQKYSEINLTKIQHLYSETHKTLLKKLKTNGSILCNESKNLILL